MMVDTTKEVGSKEKRMVMELNKVMHRDMKVCGQMECRKEKEFSIKDMKENTKVLGKKEKHTDNLSILMEIMILRTIKNTKTAS
jgi:hypothetical protein